MVPYSLEKSRRKTIGIIVKPNGDVHVKGPQRLSEERIIEFVNSKSKWIVQKHFELKSKYIEPSFKENDSLNILGKQYMLEIVKSSKRKSKIEIIDDNIVAFIPDNLNKDDEEKCVEKLYDKLIFEIALKKVPEEINKVSSIVGLKPKELKIRNFKRAWGNCSNKKVISINKDVCKYSLNAIDYVCLHEICHLKYMNHSKDFWNMVERFMPNYKNIQKELR